ncbi:hypothetical protein EYR36_009795 [Pleurotus pulmonarius]|nr:hypothetical protein EYR36_009795 [Pleurotus pulmonarius]
MMADLGMSWANATGSSDLEWDATRHYKQRSCFLYLKLAFWRRITDGTMPPKNDTVSLTMVDVMAQRFKRSSAIAGGYSLALEHGRLKTRLRVGWTYHLELDGPDTISSRQLSYVGMGLRTLRLALENHFQRPVLLLETQKAICTSILTTSIPERCDPLERYEDGLRARSGTEPAVESLSTAVDVVAASAASALVAEGDVPGRRDASGFGCPEASVATVVDTAGATADGALAAAAVNHSGLASASGERVVSFLADEGELRIRGAEPVVQLSIADDVGCFGVL